MQSVNNAGLVSTVKATAQPTRIRTAPRPEAVAIIGELADSGRRQPDNQLGVLDGRAAGLRFLSRWPVGRQIIGMPEMGFYKLVPNNTMVRVWP